MLYGLLTVTGTRGNEPPTTLPLTSGPGINLLNFAKFSLKYLLSVPHGGCSKVGMGGHLQSSSWGMMTQSHGSGLDHVHSFRMVLANGTVRV